MMYLHVLHELLGWRIGKAGLVQRHAAFGIMVVLVILAIAQ